jgi:hypothetical protein
MPRLVKISTLIYIIFYLFGKYREIKNSCLLLVKKKIESPPDILVTRNPNWSQRLGTGTDYIIKRY